MFTNMEQVIKANKAAGQCWFSEATMHFFSSSVVSPLIQNRYFVTREVDPEGNEGFTVREVLDNGAIITPGVFMGHTHINSAIVSAKVM